MTESHIAAFFDLDGTLMTGHVWRGLAHYIHQYKVNRRRYYPFMLTHLAMYLGIKARVLSRDRVMQNWGRDMTILLKGMAPDHAREVFQFILREELLPTLREDVLATLRWHQQQGHMVVLVSGTFQDLLAQVGQELGVEHVVGSLLEVRHGRLTGRLDGPFCFGRYKARRVQSYVASQGLPVRWHASYAYADRIQDRFLMELVGRPVAVYPDEELRKLAQERGWPILDAHSPFVPALQMEH